METSEIISKNNVSISSPSQEEEPWDDEKFQELVESLPKAKGYYGPLYFYQGFWCPSFSFKGFISFQKYFQALDTDIILVSMPKSGTTWLKALIFSIANRHKFSLQDNPLLNLGPHSLVPFLESDLYLKTPNPNFENCPNHPRILSTHTPYASLPPSIKDDHSKCKIVYVCRNPMDVFISYWHYLGKLRTENMEPMSMDEGFEMFCQGIHGFGPFSDHVLGYWKANEENPNKILFLKYEDLKEDITFHVKELAKFLGFPFSKEEEDRGVVEEIARLCSFDSLKDLEVNKSGKSPLGYPNSVFFRNGEVGNWRNFLKPSMVEHWEKLLQEKFDKSGLTFNFSCKNLEG
ncbi:hypothetical protein COLO4_28642 [Corchorus olitorius]|uniref:Sulfotransferase n=1 Tax=Corchorus olitorius TaxID=93759 RepID=A0A1R3HJ33_9ROSI|nr:hypothetical protein COLO4_28642 [Corchorus olitorius]